MTSPTAGGGPGRLDADLDDRLAEGLRLVEERLHGAVNFAGLPTAEAARHLVSAGGKRVRPTLTLLAAELGSGINEAVIDAACVVELTHLATLYHDDVMDSAPTRRGAPAAHEVWGNTVAILTGDMLFARASKLVAGLGVEAVRVQAETFERLCAGQIQETVGPAEGEDAVAHYLQVLADKTGSLIATSGRFGAMFGECDAAVVDTMVRFGELVGVAFQVADDVLDVMSPSGVSGKTPGTDLREGVPTLPVLYARVDAAVGDADAAAAVALVDGDLTADADLAAALVALRALPATHRARDYAVECGREAVAVLETLPESQAREALIAYSRTLVDRMT